MWVKIKAFPDRRSIIVISPSWSGVLGSSAVVAFGGRASAAEIQYRDDPESVESGTFETPGTIRLSDKLRDELHIPEAPVYQVKFGESGIIFGPVVGLLLGQATHRYNPVHMMKYSDRFGVYPRMGGLIYAFSPKYVHWDERTAYGLYYNYESSSWEYGCFPLPEVVYRRDFHTDPAVVQRLVECTGGRLFNSYRFTKYQLYEFLNLHEGLRECLPPTEACREFNQVKVLIDRHKKIILKPVHLSRGRGICVVEKTGSAYRVVDFRSKTPTVYQLFNDELFRNFFDVYPDLFENYLVQKYIPLSTIDGSPFDIRVVMHKRPDRQWGCTGIECRVSNNGYLTNISRGGYALLLDEALHRAFGGEQKALSGRILQLCGDLCRHLDRSGEHFAEFGLDIAVDVDRRLWIIEANVFPSFKGFKKISLDTYLAIRYAPMHYAYSLTSFGEA